MVTPRNHLNVWWGPVLPGNPLIPVLESPTAWPCLPICSRVSHQVTWEFSRLSEAFSLLSFHECWICVVWKHFLLTSAASSLVFHRHCPPLFTSSPWWVSYMLTSPRLPPRGPEQTHQGICAGLEEKKRLYRKIHFQVYLERKFLVTFLLSFLFFFYGIEHFWIWMGPERPCFSLSTARAIWIPLSAARYRAMADKKIWLFCKDHFSTD